MKHLGDIIIGLVAAAALILYHSAYPVVRMSYTDHRVVMCVPPSDEPPSPWQRGGI